MLFGFRVSGLGFRVDGFRVFSGIGLKAFWLGGLGQGLLAILAQGAGVIGCGV